MLSKKTQYAIHALTELAREYKQGPVLINTISERRDIPRKFLEAILLELKNAGVLGSKKGKGGGYYLLKDPEEVNLADIIRQFEGAIALLPCVTYRYYEPCPHCVEEASCGLRAIIKDLRDEMVNILKKSSLKDILDREAQLKKEQSQV
jgi:Rrf2 family protein